MQELVVRYNGARKEGNEEKGCDALLGGQIAVCDVGAGRMPDVLKNMDAVVWEKTPSKMQPFLKRQLQQINSALV